MDGNAQKETCRAPAPGPDGFVPARPRVVLALAVLDIRVVLYHAEDGAYYSIPTQMTPDEAATAAVADGRGYALGGFTAVVPEKVLAHPLAEYEICIAYRVGGFDFLASTGKTAEVTG